MGRKASCSWALKFFYQDWKSATIALNKASALEKILLWKANSPAFSQEKKGEIATRPKSIAELLLMEERGEAAPLSENTAEFLLMEAGANPVPLSADTAVRQQLVEAEAEEKRLACESFPA